MGDIVYPLTVKNSPKRVGLVQSGHMSKYLNISERTPHPTPQNPTTFSTKQNINYGSLHKLLAV
jgi:hypothetical protein